MHDMYAQWVRALTSGTSTSQTLLLLSHQCKTKQNETVTGYVQFSKKGAMPRGVITPTPYTHINANSLFLSFLKA